MADPILPLYARAEAEVPASERGDQGAFHRMMAAVHEALPLRATTPAGGLASLEWARAEFAAGHIEDGTPDLMDRFTLAMLDSALGVFRRMVAGAAHG